MIAGLPYDAEVEYLQSTGAQYIDTGVSACNAVVGTDIRFQSTSTQNNEWVFGTYSSSLGNNYNYLVGSYSGWCVGLYDNTFYRPGSPVDTGVHRVRINIDGKTRFDDVVLLDGTASKTYEGDKNTSLWMFMTHRAGSNPMNGYYLTAKVFYCKVYLDGVLVRDLVPVRFTNSNGQSEGAMYDRVSRKLFRNAGTGAFVIGPDVATPVMGLHFFKSQIKTAKDYVQNGLIAMWDGIENAGWGTHDQNITTWADLTGRGSGWLLKDSNTTQVFEVGSDYVKILSGVTYNNRGHCTPSWTSDSDIKQMEIVLDDTDFSESTTSRICALGINSGNWNSQMAIRDGNLFQFQYNKYPLLSLWKGVNAISFDGDTAKGLFNGMLVISTKSTVGSGYAYSCPVLGAYAAQAAVGVKIKSLRIYNRVLTEAEMLANYAVDKLRFNLWENPYVTDGLVAMWDGEWNAGGGVHSNAITNWADLSGSGHVMYAPTPSWGDRYALCTDSVDSRFRETSEEAAWFKSLVATGRYSIEIVVQPSGGGNSYALNYYVDGFGLMIRTQAYTTTTSGFGFWLATSGTVVNDTKENKVSGLNYLAARCMQVSCSGGDGVLVCNGQEAAISGTFGVTMESSGMALGARGTLQSWDSTDNIGVKHFCIRVYNRPLTSAELAANYAVDKVRFNLP